MDRMQLSSTPKNLQNSPMMVEPSQRRSSLAFRSQTQSPTSPRPYSEHISVSNHASNLDRPSRKDHKTPSLWSPDMSPRNSPSPLRNMLQIAKTNLHRDMFVASSPASSIESRMHVEHHATHYAASDISKDHDVHDIGPVTPWRYSIAPQCLAASCKDVREPLPSPALPEPLPTCELGTDMLVNREPASSGFTTPNVVVDRSVSYSDALNIALPFSLSNSPTSENHKNAKINPRIVGIGTALEQNMENLHVSCSPDSNEKMEESPRSGPLNQDLTGDPRSASRPASPDEMIYLSESAQAAAESAKTKRRLLRGVPKNDHNQSIDVEVNRDTYGHELRYRSDTDAHDLPQNRLKKYSVTPCPDPSAHSSRPSDLCGSKLVTSPGTLIADHNFGFERIYPIPIAPRATATGSPMPFPRQRPRPPTAQSDPYINLSDPSRHLQYTNMPHEYIDSDSYGTTAYGKPFVQPAYAFSTAASKIHGSSQAPDYRIRDSYKTNTLTAIARPPSRYRKNGIGADMLPRGVGRYYQRQSSLMRPSSVRSRPSSRRTYHGENEIRFRSSPPRAAGTEPSVSVTRKRAMDDSFLITEGQMEPGQRRTTAVTRTSNEVMQLDEETSAAVRMSIFGTNTPEALHQARLGLRELSPNVQVHRKGRQETVHLRKKRRPSYWDNDLKEIRESPAGRGGVNSPVSAQASMQAEFEIASLRNTETDLDEQEQVMDNITGDIPETGI